MSTPVRQGRVTDFDPEVGLGTVVAGAGVGKGVVGGPGVGADGGEWTFHCTAIADGSRTIAPGTPVTFTTVAGHRGRWEAADIRPMAPPG